MARLVRAALAAVVLAGLSGAALAQKPGGTLRIYHRDSPSNMSIYEEGTISVVGPMMGVFNNLVVFDPKQKLNTLDDIVPELADSWSWNADGTELTMKLHPGVKWHDGKPFTSADVKCTWDLLQGKLPDKLRLNARAAWWLNLNEVTADSELQATFHLKRRQPSFLALLASGFTPVYPCHVGASAMRQHPVGTGPFMFAEFKPNQSIKVVKNPNYWKPGLPYLDAIEWTIIPNRSTAILAFIAGNFDMTFPYEVTIPMLKDVKAQLPEAICDTEPLNVAPNLSITLKPPFDNVELRKAIAMSFDRKAIVDILGEGTGDIGTATLPAPEGQWSMPEEMRKTMPGYGSDVAKSRAEAQEIMKKLGYGPDKHLQVKISARNLAIYRDPAAILIDQMKNIYIDGEIELVETANWLPKLVRSDFVMALSLLGSGLDDPDQNFYENYVCSSNRNYIHSCDTELDAMIDKQSQETDRAKRKEMVNAIDKRLTERVVRPILYYMRQATCWRPEVKGIRQMSNSIYNGPWRFEDVWLDKK